MSAEAPGGIAARLRWTAWLASSALRRHRGATLFFVAAFAAVGAAAAAVIAAGRAPLAAVDAGGDTQLVVFLRDDLAVGAPRDRLAAALAQLPGVADVRPLGSDEALARLRVDLGPAGTLLDGVEEGFLPATLEVRLARGAEGAAAHADGLAARLLQMEGIADVDVLRAAADQRLAREAAAHRRLRRLSLGLVALAGLGGLGLAAACARRRRADARLLVGLGFTIAGLAGPAAAIGAAAAIAGAAVGQGALFLAARFGRMGAALWQQQAPVIDARLGLGLLGGAALLGAALGWWGARPPSADVEIP